MPMGKLWKVNAKDTLQSTISPLTSLYPLSVFGRPGDVPIIEPCVVTLPVHALRFILTPLFFRRISPAETPIYALSRNLFAVIAIAVVVFRAVTALQKAQNQIGTRIKSATCHLERSRPIHMLVIFFLYQGVQYWIPPTAADYCQDSEYRRIWDGEASENFDCKRTEFEHQVSQRINRTLESYVCSNLIEINVNSVGSALDVNAFDIEVRGLSPVDYRGELPVNRAPRIWLSTEEEGSSGNLTFRYPARSYLSPWELRRGFHIEAEAKLVTRKLITSSIWRDIILSSDPTYKNVPLFPLSELSTRPITPNTTASARIITRLSPAFSYFREQQQAPYDSPEDDVGSVGGLFALLQTTHVFLFGRPLLWGLTGAKLITPFGFLGALGSRGFKRRLKDQYQTKATDDDTETIRIASFLRDFVIDFGPATPEARSSSLFKGSPRISRNWWSPTFATDYRDVSESMIPLIRSRQSASSTSQEHAHTNQGEGTRIDED
ncbi:hypothetical protein RHS03_00028, partial [Rhizoctonia solani]